MLLIRGATDYLLYGIELFFTFRKIYRNDNSKIDFPSVVAWYKENGFENQVRKEGI